MLDHLCPAMLCRIFRKCIAKGTILGIKTIWHETRLIFSKTIINTFRNSVIIRGIIISWSRSSCQVAVIFAQLTKLWFPWQVFVNQQQYRILWKSTEWEPRCCQQGGRTDRHLTMLICIRFSKLFFIYAPKNRKKVAYFLKTYEEIAPNSGHTLSDDTVASISQILASIMQLQLTVIYFKLRRRDGLKQRNIHIIVLRNKSND